MVTTEEEVKFVPLITIVVPGGAQVMAEFKVLVMEVRVVCPKMVTVRVAVLLEEQPPVPVTL
jgi:hypothetical protein